MNDERRIRHQIRAWAARPPARSPRAARARVLARLEERRTWPGWRLAATAAAVVLASGLFLLGPEAPPDPPAVAARQPAPLLVYQLKSGTKLYFALNQSKGDHR